MLRPEDVPERRKKTGFPMRGASSSASRSCLGTRHGWLTVERCRTRGAMRDPDQP